MIENINLELYKVFYYVAKNENITKTSIELNISQPAITQSIKKLESELNYTLFYRTKRGVKLTEYGEYLYESIKEPIEILNSCNQNLNSLTNNEIKTIRIGGGSTLLKHNAIKGFQKFREKYPNIKIEIIRGITSELFNKLDNNEIDLLLYNETQKLDNYMTFKIEETNEQFVANSTYFKNLKNKKITNKDLCELPFVLQSSVSSSRKFLDKLCKNNKIVLKNSYELDSYDLTLSFVKAGLGIGFVNTNHIKEELENKELFIVDTNIKIPKRNICIAISKRLKDNKYLNEFIEYLKR